MKKCYTLLLLLVVAANCTFAQNEAPKPEVSYPVYFDISPPLRDMIQTIPARADNSWKDGIVRNHFRTSEDPVQKSGGNGFPGSVYQDAPGAANTDTTLQNFDGVNNIQNVNPPDTHGDVGPNHYFQVVNCAYAIYNKTGTKLIGPLNNSTVWSGMPNNSNDGDAVVLYDEQADRWIFTQFSLPNYPSGPFYQMIAVSQTPDPTGSWYRWEYQFTAMPDYPKFGIWPDGYYMGCNRFTSGSYSGIGADAFDRTAMIAGNANPARISFTLSAGNEAFTAIPSDCDGAFPPAGTPNYFTYIRTSGSQHIGVIEFHSDWATPANATFGNTLSLAVTPFTWGFTGGITQKGTSAKVPALSDRLMYRVQFRQFSDHNAMVLNHTINVGSNVAGVRWYELRKAGTDPWSVYQESTYAPADNNSRWCGSIALDPDGNIALGFSVAGTNLYPSIRYTGRMACDTIGFMTQAEKGIYNGGGSSTATGNNSRWGDYSSLSCDPSAPRTFWYTQEYFQTTSQWGWKTRIGSFALFGVNAMADPPAVCEGDSTVLMATANCGAAGTYTYLWSSIPAGLNSTLPTLTVAPTVATQYIVAVNDGNSTRTDTVFVDIHPKPVVSAGSDTLVCWYVGDVAVHGSADHVNAINWTTSGTGTFDNAQTFNTVYHPSQADKQAGFVTLTFTGTPEPPCTQEVPDDKKVTFDQCTGIAPATGTETALLIQPNPAREKVSFIISGLNSGSSLLTVTSADGKTVYSENLAQASGTVTLNLGVSGYSKGVYFVQVKNGSRIITQKMIIQ